MVSVLGESICLVFFVLCVMTKGHCSRCGGLGLLPVLCKARVGTEGCSSWRFFKNGKWETQLQQQRKMKEDLVVTHMNEQRYYHFLLLQLKFDHVKCLLLKEEQTSVLASDSGETCASHFWV